MSDNEPQPKPEHEELITMERSASKVALEFANDVKTGAGWTTGALLVTGVAKQVRDTFSGKQPEAVATESDPPPQEPKPPAEPAE